MSLVDAEVRSEDGDADDVWTEATVRDPSFDLLRALVVPDFDDAAVERVRRLAASADTTRTAELAVAHALAPLARRRLGESGIDIDPEADDRLRAVSRRTAARNLLSVAELGRLVSAFDEAGVRALSYKGPTLAVQTVGDVSLRTYGDLDFFVDRRDLLVVCAVLAEAGYERYSDGIHSPAEIVRGRTVVRPPREFSFTHPSGTSVEVRWTLGSRSRPLALDFAELWARRQYVTVGGGEVPTFSRSDLTLVCARHAAKHGWNRLAWLVDVAWLTPREQWAPLVDRSASLGVENVVLATALLADGVGADVPPSLLREGRRVDAVREAVESVVDFVVSNPFAAPAEVEMDRANALDRRLCDTRAATLRATARTLLTPELADYRALPLPRRLRPVYYLTRPFRLVAGALRMAGDGRVGESEASR